MEREPISLEAATGYILEECRMMLPGIQALFGFQLIAVFDAALVAMFAALWLGLPGAGAERPSVEL
jgi:hypothetical protein